jgi:hypothetical protein
METFGEEYTKQHYIIKIKYILNYYHNDARELQFQINMLGEEYDEILSNGDVPYESWQKQDMFNELIKKAKEEIQEENVPYRNNPPYNPFDSDDFRGGRNKRYRKNTKKNKRSKRKNKRSKKTSKRSRRKRN